MRIRLRILYRAAMFAITCSVMTSAVIYMSISISNDPVTFAHLPNLGAPSKHLRSKSNSKKLFPVKYNTTTLSTTVNKSMEQNRFTSPSNQSHNATPPSVGGALRFYKSVLDGQPVNLRCSSCALVSNSGSLLRTGAGPEIDSRSCVIRMNMAPTEGYQNDVGKRTSFRVMNFNCARKADRLVAPGSLIFVWSLFPGYFRKVKQVARKMRPTTNILGQTREGNLQAESLFSYETGLSSEKTRSKPSSGWFAVMLAKDICDEVHVYGMVPYDYCATHPNSTVPFYYFKFSDEPSKTQCAIYKAFDGETTKVSHRFITEKAIFARWSLRHNISFHYPTWKIDREKVMGKLDTPFVRNFG